MTSFPKISKLKEYQRTYPDKSGLLLYDGDEIYTSSANIPVRQFGEIIDFHDILEEMVYVRVYSSESEDGLLTKYVHSRSCVKLI